MTGRPCTTCGKVLADGARFCGQCGTRLPDSAPPGGSVAPQQPQPQSPQPILSGSMQSPVIAAPKPAARTMVEFAAPPSQALTRRGEEEDSLTVRRDRADLVELLKAHDLEKATKARSPDDEPSTMRKGPSGAPPAGPVAPAANARSDFAKTVSADKQGPNPLGRTIAEASPLGARVGGGSALDKTIADGDAVARARDMVLGALRDGHIDPPKLASVRPEPPPPDAQPNAQPAQPPQSPLSRSIGQPGPPGPSPAPQPQPAQQPPAQMARPANAHNKTMMGVAPLELAALQPQQPPPQAAPAGNANRTMLGVAIPGIAPLNPGQPSQPHASHHPQAGPSPLMSQNRTMMGVAMPGIAPTNQGQPQPQQNQGGYGRPPQQAGTQMMAAAPPPPILPAPAPYVEEALPMAPSVPRKSGVPIVAAIGLLVVLLFAGAGAAFFLYKPVPPVLAVPELDAEGRDVLKLTCEGCPDGTKISVEAATATLAAHEAHLLLPAPLKVGRNPLVLKIDRPGVGRDEDAKIEVPVAYRLRADLSTLSAQPPTITVRVEAQPGAEVKIADKPVALDATGSGALAIDVGPDTMGPSDETKRIDRTIDYAITPKGGALQKGSVRAQAGIAALRIDTPSSHAIVDADSVWVSGQTTPLAEVVVNDLKATADPSGAFELELKALAMGETKVHVVSRPKNFAARTLDFAITRVAKLDDAAKAFETEAPLPLGYDAFADGANNRNGAKVVVDGEIIEARRGAAHQWLLLVESKRGCAKLGQCLTRVQAWGEEPLTRGGRVRVYGRFLHTVSATGKTVPEVAADIMIVPKGSL